jgi:glycine/D-amino acid oxidase-like deaminating enzyme
LPFAKLNSPGVVYSTLLVEPPIFLPRLISDLAAANVARHKKTLGPMNAVLNDHDITQRIIVNCTGLGATVVAGDPTVHGVKGQLAMLPAQPALDYLFCAPGYLFPRKDAVVVGGTEEPEGSYKDDKADINECKRILARVQRAFEPKIHHMFMPNFLVAQLGPKHFIENK